MMIPRPLAASLASCLSHTVFYPLDTRKTIAQTNFSIINDNTRDIYKGIIPASSGAFVTTGIYYSIYEHYRMIISITFSVLIATLATGVAVIPFDFYRKKQQLKNNTKITWSIFKNTYILFMLRVLPKNILKMLIYEKLLYVFSAQLSSGVCGLLSSIISTLITFFLLFPLDNWNTFLLTKTQFSLKNLIQFKGLSYGIVHKLSTNAFGHYCLEKMSPRY